MHELKMASRGGPTESALNQSFTPKVPTIAAPYPSMGYASEFQLSEGSQAKENAAADGPRNGAKLDKKRDISCGDDTPKLGCPASKLLTDRYGDDLQDRVQHALDALADLEPWQAEKVAASVLGAADAPLPSFLGGMDDARFWASLATPKELDAYAAACFEVMPAYRQMAFASFASGNGGAAA